MPCGSASNRLLGAGYQCDREGQILPFPDLFPDWRDFPIVLFRCVDFAFQVLMNADYRKFSVLELFVQINQRRHGVDARGTQIAPEVDQDDPPPQIT